ncbi:MaoC family dehydratase [Mycolicibacterium holsaticum]|uniref:Enoyl-CoA hydratase n=1 Tax=Mycolicibacterium holsaticum TaxID=152142 RepID=A0A1E3R8A1_9MYCO|nr:MaoC family dehydratase [Mycolicibacterium holsaticum]ODQ86176.1 enoyl-CoA hydratase [Mycolicibacterium holsaticum]
MRHINGVPELKALVGQRLGESRWLTIDQKLIDSFADDTCDHNWIHVDPDKAGRTPFGGTIAHGFHSMALIGGLIQEIFFIDHIRMGLNYGVNKARFPQAVTVDSQVRLSVDLNDVVVAADDSADAHYHCVIEIADQTKPACVADIVFRYYPEASPQ